MIFGLRPLVFGFEGLNRKNQKPKTKGPRPKTWLGVRYADS